MTTKEYVEHKYDILWEDKIIEFNKQLIEKYPWLSYEREWFWSDDNSLDGYYKNLKDDYTSTWLDSLNDGWRIAFGDNLVKEIDDELKRCNCLDQFSIIQIKEKFGELRFSVSNMPVETKIRDIIDKYAELSSITCINCGEPAKYLTNNYVVPICEKCKEELEKDSYLTFRML